MVLANNILRVVISLVVVRSSSCRKNVCACIW